MRPVETGEGVEGPVERAVLRDLAPTFSVRFVDAAGARLRLLEGGPRDRSTLLVLHGRGAASTSSFPILPELARAHHVVAVDLPGFGSSVAAPGPAPRDLRDALAFFADPIAALIEAEGLSGASVLGHSLGGLVALDLALRPELHVAKLVLVASMGLGPQVTFGARAFFRVGPERLARWLGPRLFSRLSPFPDTPVGQRLGALAYELYAAPGGHAAAARAFEALAPVLGPAPHLAARLGEVRAPTLLLWGERDEAIPAPLAIAGASALPNGELHMMAAAHSPHLEDPDAALPVVLRFLAKG
jgi:pimeloyl-ACP methyl ester carboxylesterase